MNPLKYSHGSLYIGFREARYLNTPLDFKLMKLSFYKYHGTGNDFVIFDNRTNILSQNNPKLYSHLCNRRFGIGADGVMLLGQPRHPQSDFAMTYFNADGKQGSMCGNGGRCLVAFAAKLGIVGDQTTFEAADGLYKAEIDAKYIRLHMRDVSSVQDFDSHLFLDTGSPHHVAMVNDLANFDVEKEGKIIRTAAAYLPNGTNVNFVEQKSEGRFAIRTYERGVEAETLSCGTGVTAVAIAMHANKTTKNTTIIVETLGGELQVCFKKTTRAYENIVLQGAAQFVFQGEIKID